MRDRYIKNMMNNLRREKLLSISNIFIMTTTFFVLGIFISVVVVTQTVIKRLEQQAQVTIFFKDDFTEDQILDLEKNLKSDERIFDVAYVSKEQAYEIFKEINKDDDVLLESVTSSILPASLEIRAKTLSDLPKLAEEFNTIDGVEEVRFFEDVISRFREFSNLVYLVGFILVFVFLIISYAVIFSTLRMTIHAKSKELEILKLVGARDSYVRMPLVYQGVLYGVIASFISGVLLIILINLLVYFSVVPLKFGLGFLPNISISPLLFSFILWFVLVVSGTLLGFLGSALAIKKYLKY